MDALYVECPEMYTVENTNINKENFISINLESSIEAKKQTAKIQHTDIKHRVEY